MPSAAASAMMQSGMNSASPITTFASVQSSLIGLPSCWPYGRMPRPDSGPAFVRKTCNAQRITQYGLARSLRRANQRLGQHRGAQLRIASHREHEHTFGTLLTERLMRPTSKVFLVLGTISLGAISRE